MLISRKSFYLSHLLWNKVRPVSLLMFIAKTLERFVFNQRPTFLNQHKQLDANQSGFKSKHSTETAMLSVTEALWLAKAECKSSFLFLLDLSAAFDTVNHPILLAIVSEITDNPLLWFKCYLSDRSFRVSCRGALSKAHHVVTGVFQGSVLGPFLFSIQITSL